ncbi:hypothetical protein [Thermoactinospora rubra]|uniref:hypothetical protein n=1 Tax=Thermoactinospora rubra TaxID=1088767 RepID=UPI000A10F0FB|nr:hypothetical protein [Thermoactinospora rubra]
MTSFKRALAGLAIGTTLTGGVVGLGAATTTTAAAATVVSSNTTTVGSFDAGWGGCGFWRFRRCGGWGWRGFGWRGWGWRRHKDKIVIVNNNNNTNNNDDGHRHHDD